jgi:hypothetical protein
MARSIPVINLGNSQKRRDRLAFKNYVLQINKETFLYQFNPTEIELIDDIYFKLYLRNKRFIVDILQVDSIKDYIDIYLFGVRQPFDRWNIEQVENDIIVTFTEKITRLPAEVGVNDFEIKGKIAEVE